jgi:hypothetical protein
MSTKSGAMSESSQNVDHALAECRRTYVPRRTPPCRPEDFVCDRPEYLVARRHYHALMVEAGMLDPRFAEK